MVTDSQLDTASSMGVVAVRVGLGKRGDSFFVMLENGYILIFDKFKFVFGGHPDM